MKKIDIIMVTSSEEITIELAEKPDSLAVDYKGGSGEGTIDLDGLSYEEKSEDEIKGKIGSGEIYDKSTDQLLRFSAEVK
ncbi:hypothetical protein [Bacillus sp. V2I10]|uniref:hypothetical protein n=1 Tax=Bacillus sp. V2I10 TaxID=3042276 RepID=UPI0027847594|nr:hypothetical protein [Bacillus sp. V2I10]MDQ0860640.1 hypothetical protein [Bacillus sp. V2I10]